MNGMDSWSLQGRQTCWMTWIHRVERIGTCCFGGWLVFSYCEPVGVVAVGGIESNGIDWW
jgi:hypothetical protein